MKTTNPASSRRLSGVDSAFLYLERREIPLNIGALCVFEGEIPFGEFSANIDSKLHLLPRYRQVVVAPPFNLGYPTWEDDPHFDIRQHIFQTALEAPGGDLQLEALTGRILGQVLDRGKPLWDLHVVNGLANGRGALVVRVHHSLADGIAGTAFLKLFLDEKPETPVISKPRRRIRRRAAIPKPSLAAAAASGILTSLDHLIAVQAGVLQLAETVLGDRDGLLPGLARLLPELLGAVERLPFNRPCGGERKFCWAEVDFSDVQAVRAAHGGSVNDVVLTVLTRAIRRYVELHGQTTVNRLIRVVCPVNLRRDNDETMGNQISFLPVVLPLDVKNPVRNLEAVTARTTLMKRARAADWVALAACCLGIAPPPVQALMWQGISQVMLPLPLFNMICTNVPGSPAPLYCLGRRMLAIYPQVPTGYELGINCAVQTYCGKLSWGLIADAEVAPDVTRLRDFVLAAFEDLCRASGLRKRVRPRRSRPVEATAAAAN